MVDKRLGNVMTENFKAFFLIGFLIFGHSCISADHAMKHGLTSLKGKPIQAAIDLFGLPDGKMNLQDYNVYVWGNQNIGTYYYNNRPYVYQSKCEIKLQCDSADSILGWEYRGNTNGCMPYAEKLWERIKQLCSRACQKIESDNQLRKGESVDGCASDCAQRPNNYDLEVTYLRSGG
jgi:hypothetical protein